MRRVLLAAALLLGGAAVSFAGPYPGSSYSPSIIRIQTRLIQLLNNLTVGASIYMDGSVLTIENGIDSIEIGHGPQTQDVTLSARDLDFEGTDGSLFHDLANITLQSPDVEIDGPLAITTSLIVPGTTDANFLISNSVGAAVNRIEGHSYAKLEFDADGGDADSGKWQIYTRSDGVNTNVWHQGAVNDAENAESLAEEITRVGLSITLHEFGAALAQFDGSVSIASQLIVSGSVELNAYAGNHIPYIDNFSVLEVSDAAQFDGTTSTFTNVNISALVATKINVSSFNVTTSGNLYSAGAKVGLDFSAYVSLGTPFTLTTTTNTINVGSSSMTVTLASSGTYSLNGFTTLFENGSTFAANDFITMHIYRQNNTPGKLTNSQVWYETPVSVSALTATIGQMRTPPDLKYTTTNTNDVLSLQIQISAAPGAGSVQAKESGLVATRLY